MIYFNKNRLSLILASLYIIKFNIVLYIINSLILASFNFIINCYIQLKQEQNSSRITKDPKQPSKPPKDIHCKMKLTYDLINMNLTL